MYVACSCGRRHWGPEGAAGLLLTTADRASVLLQHRSEHVHQGNTWACVGGAIEAGETVIEAALREAQEEEGLDPAVIEPIETIVGTRHPEWSYTYVLAHTAEAAVPNAPSWGWETAGVQWFGLDDVAALDLHPSFAADWPWLMRRLAR